jgi:hypothetical protein
MWFLKYVVYVGFKHLNDDFRVKFMKHFVRRSWSLTQVKTRSEHDSKWPEDRSMTPWNSKDPNGRCESLSAKYPYQNREENGVKDQHAVRQRVKKTQEASGRKKGPNRAEKGLGRSAHADRPTLFLARFGLPFDLVPPRLINSLCLRWPTHPFMTT